MPMVVTELVNGEPRYDVIAKDKDLRIVCAGCFREGMTLVDDSRCKKCAFFVKHWDTKNGERRLKCKEILMETVAAEAEPVAMKFDEVTRRLDDGQIIEEVKDRGLEWTVAEQMDEVTFAEVMMARGIWPLYNARPTWLVHEIRRQHRDVEVLGDYYHGEKKRAFAHSSDEVGIELLEKAEDLSRETRQAKKAKIIKTPFQPRKLTDYR